MKNELKPGEGVREERNGRVEEARKSRAATREGSERWWMRKDLGQIKRGVNWGEGTWGMEERRRRKEEINGRQWRR